MSLTLVIVESPAKAKTIQEYLGAGYFVKASMGHITDLPKSFMPTAADGYKLEYELSSSKAKTVRELTELAKRAQQIILATDMDREGEAIAWHVAKLLQLDIQAVPRAVFKEITKKGIAAGLQGMRLLDLHMVDAQQARRALDRLVGYKLSGSLHRATNNWKLSAGRVQSVALRYIVDRQADIDAFVPSTDYTLQASLLAAEAEYSGIYCPAGEETRFASEAAVQETAMSLGSQAFYILSREEGRKKRNPPLPFTTATLQQEASRRLKWDIAKVMKVAQELYEGVVVPGHGRTGLITYMRTDSTRIAPDFQSETRRYLLETVKFESKYVAKGARRGKDAHAQDAHEAIRPTHLDAPPRKVKTILTPDQAALYELIYYRYMMSQMTAAEMLSVVLWTGDAQGRKMFKSTGSTLVFDGWLKIQSYLSGEREEDEEEALPPLPNLTPGTEAQVINSNARKHDKRPPTPFTQATLVKQLEKANVGRPSTYASIIEVLYRRNYVEGKVQIRPTDMGKEVSSFLVRYFALFTEETFTAAMEKKLDLIAEGKASYSPVIADYAQTVDKLLWAAGGERMGRATAMISCNGKTEKTAQPEIQQEDPCPRGCGGRLVERKNKTSGETFWGCSNFPNCRTTRANREKSADGHLGKTENGRMETSGTEDKGGCV